jgi:ABC-type branched-subunit amino acid transport system substrate-binding protein
VLNKLLTWLKANPAATYMYLASATGVIFVIAIVSALVVKDDGKGAPTVSALPSTTLTTGNTATPAGDTATTGAATQATAGSTAATTKKTTTVATGTVKRDTTQPTLPSVAGATRVGVSNTTIKWGLHAPKTLQGVPWGLADDVLKGVRIYLNQVNQQKVNGRTIVEYFADDRYDANSGAAAGDTLITDDKVFFAQGTLGVDQVAQVAKKARASSPAPTPYMAAGGAEVKFKDIGMFQISGSYDTHLAALIHFLDAEVDKPVCPKSGAQFTPGCPLDKSPYGGILAPGKKVRIGVSALNSEYIKPAVDTLKAAVAASRNLTMGPVVTVEKPEGGTQTTYTNQVLTLANGSDIVVPAQDPLSTAGEARECQAQAATCHFLWTMSDFAHDGDVDLALMNGSWTGLRGLSSGCYYLNLTTPNCSKLSVAHTVWVNGTDPNVDNGGGDKGDGSKQTESTWNSNGQSGVAGYQIVHFWLKALTDAGTDPTREKLTAALNSYSGYDDLITTPLSFLNSPNKAHGINGFAIYQAGAPDSAKPKGVGWSMLSNGLIGNL